MVVEFAHETCYEDIDTVLNNLEFQMSTSGVPKDGEERMAAVTPGWSSIQLNRPSGGQKITMCTVRACACHKTDRATPVSTQSTPQIELMTTLRDPQARPRRPRLPRTWSAPKSSTLFFCLLAALFPFTVRFVGSASQLSRSPMQDRLKRSTFFHPELITLVPICFPPRESCEEHRLLSVFDSTRAQVWDPMPAENATQVVQKYYLAITVIHWAR
jgi:hypothetical protein